MTQFKSSWKSVALLAVGVLQLAVAVGMAQLPVLKRSDVVFMYQASRQTYEDYGATVLAWGGTPGPKTLKDAEGVKFFGSVGMVTEFGRFYDRFPQDYEQALCRDVEGNPYRVPWLKDHQKNGIPYWWCCTRQPLFRQYISERVAGIVKAGANGVHIDDHLGTAGGITHGGCFCDRCVAEFRDYLKQLPPEDLRKAGISDPGAFNYREVVRNWLRENPGRKATEHPLWWSHWRVYQLRNTASFMAELRQLAAKTAGHPVPVGANAGLLWGPHLADYRSIDLFSAEISHNAKARRFCDDPLVAYRLAEAVGRPLAATASGQDWSFIKEQNLTGLVLGWAALSYAAGHQLMAPHHQWCYTPEKGTHWYEGPKEKYAPFFRFIRENATLFDGYETFADLTVAFSERTFDRSSAKTISLCNKLAAANISYRFALGETDFFDHPLSEKDFRNVSRLLVLETNDFSAADKNILAAASPGQRFGSVEVVLTNVTPAVRVEAAGPVRVLPRVKPGAAVIHLVNWTYQPEDDSVKPLKDVRLKLDLAAFGVANVEKARLFTPGTAPVTLKVKDGSLVVPELELWGMVELRKK